LASAGARKCDDKRVQKPVASSALRVLGAKGLKVSRFLTGNYVTSLEMAGCSITISLLDDELRSLWDAPVRTAALRWGT
jgi:dihydroxyacetone kinase-like protein